MDLKILFSIFVTIFSLALVVIGIPAQIMKNYREKRSGQPELTILIAVGFYASQIAFFIITKSYIPLISFGIGIIMWLIVLYQYLVYKKP